MVFLERVSNFLFFISLTKNIFSADFKNTRKFSTEHKPVQNLSYTVGLQIIQFELF